MTCSGRNLLPCSCCQDGAQSLVLPWWYIPYIQISWPGCWYETRCSDPSLSYDWPQLIFPDVLIVLFDLSLNGPPSLSNVDLPHQQGILYMQGVFKPKSSLMGWRKLAMFLGRTPAVLICDCRFIQQRVWRPPKSDLLVYLLPQAD